MKKIENKKFQSYDWEGNEFPLKVTELFSLTNHYKIPSDSTIEIFRDYDYSLKGILKGVTKNPKELEYYEDDELKKVGFIKGETIEAKSNGNIYRIKGFGISFINQIPFKKDDVLYFEFRCEVYLEGIELVNNSNILPDKICDYSLCSIPDILFSGLTKRINFSEHYKYRTSLDHYEENIEYFGNGYSSSWDYFVLNYQNQIICIQAVNKKYLPDNMDGILVEYRNISNDFPDQYFRKIVQEFLSFIFGSHLQNIGSSSFINGYELIATESINPWSRKLYKNINMNPIPLSNGKDRNFLEKILNELFSNFVNQYNKISLSDCLWKLWIGQSSPLGTNLPTLSSGLESLIDSFVKVHGLQKTYSKDEKNNYHILIKDELESLEKKLEGYEFKSSIINKIKNPYNFSIGEKMRVFFKYLEIHFDKKSIENQALLARNQMTHQAINYDTVEEQQRIKKISDAYATLIHRVILKILGYNFYYIDYSKQGIKYLHIDKNM
ncbi:hypothetical protein [Chryseobacterium timonianum]|uniref:hypothetical protein n=1 Tax=Chryseobacterium timonianum TaxID=1805473 RepID=UPI00083AECB9|nr:hypothetical protein [Chryseobacterium timonianum]